MKRNASERINKYAAKIDGNVIGGRYEATKDLSVGKQKIYFPRAVKLEEAVKFVMSNVPSIQHHFYIAFAEEFTTKTTSNEQSIVFNKWLSRGLSNSVMQMVIDALIGDGEVFSQRYEFDDSVPSGPEGIYNNRWKAQVFTVGTVGINEDHRIRFVRLQIYRLGLPGILTVSLRQVDGAGLPTGVDLCSGTTNGNSLTAAAPGEWRTIDLSSYNLLANVDYAIVARAIDGGAVDLVNWSRTSGGSTYAGGMACWSNDDGVTWNTIPLKDHMFEEWGASL